MKKLLSSTVLFITLLSFTGCSPAKKDEPVGTEDLINAINDSKPYDWQTVKNEKYGFEFKHPDFIEFSNGEESPYGFYTVAGNYITEDGKDNYFNLTVTDKQLVEDQTEEQQFTTPNKFAPISIDFNNGRFNIRESYGTANYYFVEASYEGKNYLYEFTMSNPEYSKKMSAIFMLMLNDFIIDENNLLIATPETCGIENCHGMIVKCGPNIAQMCTEMYQAGDKCRQYASCQVTNGTCDTTYAKEYMTCATCVEKCSKDFPDDAAKLFECEGKCA